MIKLPVDACFKKDLNYKVCVLGALNVGLGAGRIASFLSRSDIDSFIGKEAEERIRLFNFCPYCGGDNSNQLREILPNSIHFIKE